MFVSHLVPNDTDIQLCLGYVEVNNVGHRSSVDRLENCNASDEETSDDGFVNECASSIESEYVSAIEEDSGDEPVDYHESSTDSEYDLVEEDTDDELVDYYTSSANPEYDYPVQVSQATHSYYFGNCLKRPRSPMSDSVDCERPSKIRRLDGEITASEKAVSLTADRNILHPSSGPYAINFNQYIVLRITIDRKPILSLPDKPIALRYCYNTMELFATLKAIVPWIFPNGFTKDNHTFTVFRYKQDGEPIIEQLNSPARVTSSNGFSTDSTTDKLPTQFTNVWLYNLSEATSLMELPRLTVHTPPSAGVRKRVPRSKEKEVVSFHEKLDTMLKKRIGQPLLPLPSFLSKLLGPKEQDKLQKFHLPTPCYLYNGESDLVLRGPGEMFSQPYPLRPRPRLPC